MFILFLVRFFFFLFLSSHLTDKERRLKPTTPNNFYNKKKNSRHSMRFGSRARNFNRKNFYFSIFFRRSPPPLSSVCATTSVTHTQARAFIAPGLIQRVVDGIFYSTIGEKKISIGKMATRNVGTHKNICRQSSSPPFSLSYIRKNHLIRGQWQEPPLLCF